MLVWFTTSVMRKEGLVEKGTGKRTNPLMTSRRKPSQGEQKQGQGEERL